MVVAGTDGALPSVVAGLVEAPVVSCYPYFGCSASSSLMHPLLGLPGAASVCSTQCNFIETPASCRKATCVSSIGQPSPAWAACSDCCGRCVLRAAACPAGAAACSGPQLHTAWALTLCLQSVTLIWLPVLQIAVPTSAGYGAALQGLTPLLSALVSSSPGVAVVNIDNGFGAAMLAARMLKSAAKLRRAAM